MLKPKGQHGIGVPSRIWEVSSGGRGRGGDPKIGGDIKLWRRIQLEASHCHLSALNLWWRPWMEMVEVAAESVFSQGL